MLQSVSFAQAAPPIQGLESVYSAMGSVKKIFRSSNPFRALKKKFSSLPNPESATPTSPDCMEVREGSSLNKDECAKIDKDRPFNLAAEFNSAQHLVFSLMNSALSQGQKKNLDLLVSELTTISTAIKEGELEAKAQTVNGATVKNGLALLLSLTTPSEEAPAQKEFASRAQKAYLKLMRAISISPALLPLLKHPEAKPRSFKLVEQSVNLKRNWNAAEVQEAIVKDLYRDQRQHFFAESAGKKLHNLHDLFVEYKKAHPSTVDDLDQFKAFFNHEVIEVGNHLKTQMVAHPDLKNLGITFDAGRDPYQNSALYLMYLLTQQTWATTAQEVMMETVQSGKGLGAGLKHNWSYFDLDTQTVKRFGVFELIQQSDTGDSMRTTSTDFTELDMHCRPIETCKEGKSYFHSMLAQ
jgi:hypothetical protein